MAARRRRVPLGSPRLFPVAAVTLPVCIVAGCFAELDPADRSNRCPEHRDADSVAAEVARARQLVAAGIRAEHTRRT